LRVYSVYVVYPMGTPLNIIFYEEMKEQELKISSLYWILDVMVSSIDEWFSQETMQTISAVNKLLITTTDLSFVSKTFQCGSEWIPWNRS